MPIGKLNDTHVFSMMEIRTVVATTLIKVFRVRVSTIASQKYCWLTFVLNGVSDVFLVDEHVLDDHRIVARTIEKQYDVYIWRTSTSWPHFHPFHPLILRFFSTISQPPITNRNQLVNQAGGITWLIDRQVPLLSVLAFYEYRAWRNPKGRPLWFLKHLLYEEHQDKVNLVNFMYQMHLKSPSRGRTT